ncbi:MAG: hypothetical protein DRQ88_04380 [Epsilonproteobacteria bacterium]|nr:MAG: hypothetical protein DRQ89_10060 [Campylobacterota bacterium]RLA66995.1 MAG: hypothetical protein DRQ88_04380 [Campylobacterota bacterium]
MVSWPYYKKQKMKLIVKLEKSFAPIKSYIERKNLAIFHMSHKETNCSNRSCHAKSYLKRASSKVFANLTQNC